MLAVKRIVPDIRTYREALFCGHFGPMGLGALFLAMEARAQLERGTSLPLPAPPHRKLPYSEKASAVELIWPVICFIVLGSTTVRGLSVAAISIGGHYSRKDGERAPLIGTQAEALYGMDHRSNEGDSEPSISGDELPYLM
jgi:NhaP-type Na+/H+ or K+/H+ antiporter